MTTKTKSPDTTARVAREQLVAQARLGPAAQRFVWPAPPYYEFSDPASLGDECMLVFRDGGKASGKLLDFVPDEAQLKFRSRESSEDVSIAFASLLRVQLLKPVALRRQPVRIDDTTSPPGRRDTRKPLTVNAASVVAGGEDSGRSPSVDAKTKDGR